MIELDTLSVPEILKQAVGMLLGKIKPCPAQEPNKCDCNAKQTGPTDCNKCCTMSIRSGYEKCNTCEEMCAMLREYLEKEGKL